MAKFFIYKFKVSNMEPSLKVFEAKIKFVYDIERQITVKYNKLTKHYNKCFTIGNIYFTYLNSNFVSWSLYIFC